MTAEQKIIKTKLGVLELANQAGGVSASGEGDHRSAPWGHDRLVHPLLDGSLLVSH